jgi:hypothetical protein
MRVSRVGGNFWVLKRLPSWFKYSSSLNHRYHGMVGRPENNMGTIETDFSSYNKHHSEKGKERQTEFFIKPQVNIN